MDSSNVSIVYGSHDANATDDAEIIQCADRSLLPSSTTDDYDEISAGKSGPIFTGEDQSFYIYGVSYYDMMNPDGGAEAAQAFRSWVEGIDPEIPVILIGHVPIHSKRGDNRGASFWDLLPG